MSYKALVCPSRQEGGFLLFPVSTQIFLVAFAGGGEEVGWQLKRARIQTPAMFGVSEM